MSALREIFVDELKDIYHAEKQLLKALPKLAKAAQSDELRTAFEQHLDETENQIQRLEQVFEAIDEKAQAKPCKAMEGLVAEAQEILQEHKGSEGLDAALICAAQKVEHYEIATYGCLCQWAATLQEEEALELLKETMDEEETADATLTEIAESSVNESAASSEESASEGEEEASSGSRAKSSVR